MGTDFSRVTCTLAEVLIEATLLETLLKNTHEILVKELM